MKPLKGTFNLVPVMCFMTAIFTSLRIGGVINWPILWILSPLWVPSVTVVGIFVFVTAFSLVLIILDNIVDAIVDAILR